jgi:predicted PurR-regulated permease PerM
MKASANVNPLASIVAILIGLNLGGVMGALLGVPLYILIRTIYATYFYEHRL